MSLPKAILLMHDLSRGISLKELSTGRWINGPDFLSKPRTEWPMDERREVSREDSEKKKPPNPMAVVRKSQPLLNPENFSSWEKLSRVTAHCLRFVDNMKFTIRDPSKVQQGVLKPEDLENAEEYWFRECQRDVKLAEFKIGSKDGIIRAESRLNRSRLRYEQLNPVLLPVLLRIPVSLSFSLIMRSMHIKVKHAGRERTLSESRAKYWILGGRIFAKNLIHDCVLCRKARQQPHSTLMGSLPPERLEVQSPPFTVTGVDLFGLFPSQVREEQIDQSLGSHLRMRNNKRNPSRSRRERISRSFLTSSQALRISPWLAKHHNLIQRRLV